MPDDPIPPVSAYAAAGVDIDAMNRAKRLIGESVRSTRIPGVLADFGSFGGLFALGQLGMRDPVLVTSIDGVGTKLKVAVVLGRHDTVGADLVAHCVNDILVCGARPVLFLDYLGVGAVPPDTIARVVAGVAAGCRAAGCALIGGETAQMPGVYDEGDYDLAGCIIGVIERDAIITGERIRAGDIVIGLSARGLHTNGYSLARAAFAGMDWTAPVPELGMNLGDALLLPHQSYLVPIRRILDDPALAAGVTGMAHITGGGVLENIPRILPDGVGVTLDAQCWRIPPIFHLIQSRADVAWEEMARVFNLGIGYTVIVRPDAAPRILAALGDGAQVIGEVVEHVAGPRVVVEGLPHA